MYSYTASIFWYLSWPLLILVSFLAIRWTLKKFERVFSATDAEEAAENPPGGQDNIEQHNKEQTSN
ncbi:MAG: hypothetical protein ACOC4R_02520 [Bacteroidota bacterium]